MKKPAKVTDAADRPPAPTKGVVIARNNRAQCNDLTDEQRSALMARAMVTIYGETTAKASARRR